MIIFFIFVFILLVGIDVSSAQASTSIDIISKITAEFNKTVTTWYGKLTAVAINLFFIILLFEFIWTSIMAALQQMETKDYLINFVKIVFFGLIFLTIINNYQEWSKDVIFGLLKVADLGQNNIYADNPLIAGLELSKVLFSKVKWTDIGLFIAVAISSFIIVICFGLITAKIVVIKCEVMVGILVSILLIPLGASNMFREYAINAIRYAVSVGFKLLTLTLIMGVAFSFINMLQIEDNEMDTILTIIGFSIVLLCISFTLPDTIASLVSSAHGSSGNMLQALNTVANTATAAAAGAMAITSIPGKIAGGAVDTARGGKEVWDTFKGAKGKGAWDTTKNLGKEALALRDQAKLNNSSIGKELLNRHNARKIPKGKDKKDEKEE